jgi:hypothetical protein
MIISIHQPNYLPWVGFFYKIVKSDIFVILDDVNYIKNSYADRCTIKTPQGSCYLKIPVLAKNTVSLYNNTLLNDSINWREKHIKTIEVNYKKSKYFNVFFENIRNIILDSSLTDLSAFNSKLIQYIIAELDIKTKVVFSSSIQVKSSSTQRLVDIIKKLSGTTYISGHGAKGYQDESLFSSNGIQLKYSDFLIKEYNQLWGDFLPGLSIIDLLFNNGKESFDFLIKSSN